MSGKSVNLPEKLDGPDEFSMMAYKDQVYPHFNATDDSERVHLTEYLEIMQRRKWIVILAFIIIVAAVAVGTFITPPKYAASVRILLGMQPTLKNPVGDSSEYIPAMNQYYQTQVNLLSSRTLAHDVVRHFKPEQILAIMPEQEAEKLKPADFTDINGDEEADEGFQGDDDAILHSAEVMKWYLDNLEVTPISDSSLVDISFTGTDPAFVTQIINRHARTAIQYTIQQHQNQAKEALNWLKKQIEDQKTAVQEAQSAIFQFKKKYNTLSLEDNQSEFAKEIQELNNEYAKAKSDRLRKQAVYIQLQQIEKNAGDILLLPEVANYSVIQGLRNQLAGLNYKRIEMKTKYGPKHPKMIELTNGLRQLQAEIALETNRLKRAIEADLDRANAIEASIEKALNRHKQMAMSLSEKSIDYEVLKQQAQSAQDVYDFLLKQSEQLGLSSVISSSSMRIVDLAEVPIEPVSPKILLNLSIGVFLAFFISTGLAVLVDFLDNSIKTTEDITRRSGLPVLGMIPFKREMLEVKKAVPLLVDRSQGKSSSDNRPLSDTTTYHISSRLPEKLRVHMEKFFGRVLVVESATAGEGKSTLAAKISSNLAEAGQRVLLVDFDFMRPSLDKMFNVSNGGSGLGHFIDLIQSHNVTSGTLKEYSVDDLFFLIGLKKMSGHMMIRNEDQKFIAHFHHGVLLHLQNQNNPEANRLGNMLVNAGAISKEQLRDALVRNVRTRQPLGYILVNAGYIGRDKLKGPLRLQIEEYIQKIFSWKNGEFHFKQGMIRIYDNEKIFFEEDYTPLINSLGRMDISKFFEKELFSQIKGVNRHNLYLLTAGKFDQSIGTLNHALIEKVFEKLKLNFDIILVDTPPLDAASGIESLFQFADGIVLVIKSGKLKVKDFNSAFHHLPQDKIIGTVLNQVKVKQHAYY